jgi:hypothetical protein
MFFSRPLFRRQRRSRQVVPSAPDHASRGSAVSSSEFDLDKQAWAFAAYAEDAAELECFNIRRFGHVVSIVSKQNEDLAYDVFITTRYWCLKPVTPLASKHIAFDGVIKPAISAIKREYDARHAGPLFDVHHPHEEKGVVTSC